MKLCHLSEDNSTSVVCPTFYTTEIQQVTSQVQVNWDILFNFMKKQEKTVSELTQEVKVSSSHHERQIADLAAKVEDDKRQICTLLTTTKRQEESKSDMLAKAMKKMLTDELQKVESWCVSWWINYSQRFQSYATSFKPAMIRLFQNSSNITAKLTNCLPNCLRL